MRCNLILSLLLISAITSWSQDRYMVFFKDKAGTPFSVSSPLAFLSQKAIDRRVNQNIDIVENDLPVSPNYVQGINDAGVKVLHKTKWMNGVLIEATQGQVDTLISQLSMVDSIEYVAPGTKTSGRIGRKFSPLGEGQTLSTDLQLEMLGIPLMDSLGFHGEGITIAVLDDGFLGVNTTNPFKQLRDDGRLNLEVSYDFVADQPDVFRYDDHGTRSLSVIAGLTNTFRSAAFNSNIQLYITEDYFSEYYVEEYNWLFAAERADSSGVDIISTSLGYSHWFDDLSMNYTTDQMDGYTTRIARAANFAASKGMLVVCSAGNEGNDPWQIIGSPADSPNVLAIGAVTSSGVKSSFSSIGPSADGRIKPDVVALGSAVTVINSSGSEVQSNGTSFSGPQVAALAAGIWQKYPQLTNSQLMDTIRSISSQAINPDNSLGYGIPNFSRLHGVIEEEEVTSTENPLASVFNIFPNPLKETLQITSTLSALTTINLLTTKGQSLSLGNFEFQPEVVESIDMSHIQPGFYILKIKSAHHEEIFKVIKL
ncbi:MAG: S8 family peptidase [Flammeovirgaceae bacterium]|nr:S8 family peptidase [Flammeovirgaceae bacterium]